eukprot:2308701-Pleurochrysis_carterae.AAC.1
MNRRETTTSSRKRPRNSRTTSSTQKRSRDSSTGKRRNTIPENLDAKLARNLNSWNTSNRYYRVTYGPLHAGLSSKAAQNAINLPGVKWPSQPGAMIVQTLNIPNTNMRRKGYGRQFMHAMFKEGNRRKKDVILELTITKNSQGLAKALERNITNGRWSRRPSNSGMPSTLDMNSWIYKHKD